MHLRHRHGHATADPRQTQEPHQRARREARRFRPRRRDAVGMRTRLQRHTRAQEKRQRDHSRDDSQCQHHIDRAPAALLQHTGQQHGPDRAREVIPTGRNRHRNPAPLQKPQRDIGDQRAETGRRAKTDHELQEGQHPDRPRHARQCKPTPNGQGRGHQRKGDPETVHRAPDHQIAQGKTDHRKGIGQRRIRPRRLKLGLHRGHDHDDRPHADIADRGNQQGHGKACPGIATVECINTHGATLAVAFALV